MEPFWEGQGEDGRWEKDDKKPLQLQAVRAELRSPPWQCREGFLCAPSLLLRVCSSCSGFVPPALLLLARPRVLALWMGGLQAQELSRLPGAPS